MSYLKEKYVKAFGGDPTESQTTITNKHRADWNNYVDWLKAKGLAGNPTLDKNGVGNQMLQQYIKENPKTSLTVDIVKPLQGEFQKYKQWVINEVKAGRSAFAQGVNENNVMEDLSTEDAYAGSKTTSHKFPYSYMVTLDKPTNTTTTQNLGFATQK